ncbi:MAG: outer membrane beta-barrel protein [Desulfobacteraceae bacterium]|nr:outer membrane beta-barrel protein [Desulfobacteraceae bacterium]
MLNNNSLALLKFSLFLVLIFLFSVHPSFASGRFTIQPIIEIGYQRDSNFNKSDTNTKTVNTYNIKPILQFSYNTDKSSATLNYGLNEIKYDDQDKNSNGNANAETFDYTAHDVKFDAKTQLTDRLLVGFDVKFNKTRDPTETDINSNETNRFKYTKTDLSPRITYGFSEKFDLDLKYSKQVTDYQDDGPGQGEDSEEDGGSVALNYYFNSKTSFDLDYKIWARDYDRNSTDYTSNQLMLNLNHQLNYFTFTAGAGYQSRDFDQNIAFDDIGRFVWKLAVSGKSTPDTTGISKTSMYFSVDSNLNNSGYGDSYHNSIRFETRFSYLLTEKINCTLGGYFQNADYETSSRNDDRYQVRIGADYYFSNYFSFGIEGGKENRHSNQRDLDFSNEYIMLNASFNYKTGSK